MSQDARVTVDVRLFGAGRVVVDGEPAPALADQPMKALALLVLNGGCMNRDTLVERLWPEVQIASGRHQLRSLLARLRASVPLRVERQGDLVVLVDPVRCDIDEFIRSASAALAGLDGRPQSLRMALHAQSLWTGPPLEAWRYEPWAIDVRRRVFLLQRGLWDLLQ